MDFYWTPASPNCRKVDAVAKQLGIELNRKPVDLTKGEHKTPEFLTLNPNGKVPVLVDGDVCLWESNAITNYVASKVDSAMWPKSVARYDIMRWQSWELAHLGAAAREITFERVIKRFQGGEPDEARCRDAEQRFDQFAAVLDQHLGKHKWLVGDGLTTADFCVAAPFTYRVPAELPLQKRKHIRQWLAALDDQPGWAASAPPPM